MKTRIRVNVLTSMALGAAISLLCGQLCAQETTFDPFDGASNNNCGHRAHPPETVSSTGFNHLSFCDDFNSISTIDASGTGGPGFNWYTKLPRGHQGGHDQTLPDAYSVSHSVLTVSSTGQTEAWALTTRDPVTGNGQAWNFGYFEARIKFDPTLGPKAIWFPAFWSVSAYHTQFHNEALYAELDFFEAFTQGPNGRGGNGNYPGEFLGTIHQWERPAQSSEGPAATSGSTGSSSGSATVMNGSSAAGAGSTLPRRNVLNYSNSNNDQPTTVDWRKWHVVGCLWVPGKVTWYLDGKALMSQEYSATAPPNPLGHLSHAPGAEKTPTPAGVFDELDTETMQVILGSAPEWPMYVDWVRVWEK